MKKRKKNTNESHLFTFRQMSCLICLILCDFRLFTCDVFWKRYSKIDCDGLHYCPHDNNYEFELSHISLFPSIDFEVFHFKPKYDHIDGCFWRWWRIWFPSSLDWLTKRQISINLGNTARDIRSYRNCEELSGSDWRHRTYDDDVLWSVA